MDCSNNISPGKLFVYCYLLFSVYGKLVFTAVLFIRGFLGTNSVDCYLPANRCSLNHSGKELRTNPGSFRGFSVLFCVCLLK